MGLEGVEIVMAVEESFGITIADKEAEKIRTPRALIELVCLKVAVSDQAHCISQRAFHRVRRAIMGTFGVPRNDIRPDAKLEQLVPASNRQESWQKLRHALKAEKWPALSPTGLHWGAAALPGVAAILCFDWGSTPREWVQLAFLCVITVFLSCVVVLPLTKRLYRGIPQECATVSGLALHLVQFNREILGSSVQTAWNRSDIAAIVRKIIGDVLGAKDFSEDADLVKDLGLS